jgi:hypothetical protein
MTLLIIVLIVIAILALGAGVVAYMVRQDEKHQTELRKGFGPEYHELRSRYGDNDRTMQELESREKRVRQYEIRPLSREDSQRYSEQWRSTQARFVDDPAGAISEADRLISEVMQKRGYPTGEFEQQSADVSVDHPQVVKNYRAAHEISDRTSRGEANTEDMRQAMIHYRSLFMELLEEAPAGTRQ